MENVQHCTSENPKIPSLVHTLLVAAINKMVACFLPATVLVCILALLPSLNKTGLPVNWDLEFSFRLLASVLCCHSETGKGSDLWMASSIGYCLQGREFMGHESLSSLI